MDFGGVIRDELGQFVAAKSLTMVGNMEVSMVEARVLVAINLCKTLGFNKIHLEGDAQTIVNAVNSSSLDWGRMGMSVEDIQLELKSFPFWRMSFVRREGNKAAHFMARLALNNSMDQLWLNEPPNFISHIVTMEGNAPLVDLN